MFPTRKEEECKWENAFHWKWNLYERSFPSFVNSKGIFLRKKKKIFKYFKQFDHSSSREQESRAVGKQPFPLHKGIAPRTGDETHKLGERKEFPSIRPTVQRYTQNVWSRPIASVCPAEKKYWSEDARKRRVRITRLSSYFSGEISVIRADHPLRLWILTNSGVPGRTRLERDRLDYGWCVRDNPGMKLIFHPQDVLL